jgi:hypothetical protein
MDKLTQFRLSAIVLLALMCCGGGLRAQQAITSFGGDVTGVTGSLSFSGGEVAVKTAYAPAVTVVNVTESFSEGVQQPITARDEQQYQGIEALTVGVAVYPNPTTDQVTVLLPMSSVRYNAMLCDMKGRKLRAIPLSGKQTTISLSDLPKGVYLLTLISPTDRHTLHIVKTL